MMYKKIILFLMPVVISLSTAFSWGQYNSHDLTWQYQLLGAQKSREEPGLNQWTSAGTLDYIGNFPLTSSFSFLSEQRLEGIVPKPSVYVDMVNFPINLISSIGIGLYSVGNLEARMQFHQMPKSKVVTFPVFADFDSGAINSPHIYGSMLQRFRNNIDVFWELSRETYALGMNAFYTNLTYDYYRLTDSIPFLTEADVWVNGWVSYSLFNNLISLKAGGLAKDDRNISKAYNLFNGYAGIENNYTLLRKKVRGLLRLYARFYKSSIYEKRNYADNLGLQPHVRFYYEFSRMFYLKAEALGDIAPHTYMTTVTDTTPDSDIITKKVQKKILYSKQRYEVSLRKEWKNRACIECGMWSSGGSLMPRQSLYLLSMIPVSETCEFNPFLRAYYVFQEKEIPSDGANQSRLHAVEPKVYTNKLYRIDSGILFRVRTSATNTTMFRNTSIQVAVKNQWMDKSALYGSLLSLELGITKYL